MQKLMEQNKVTLIELLDSREQRVWHQQELLNKYGGVLVSVTLNIPGEIKDKPEYRRVMEWGMNRLTDALQENFDGCINHSEIRFLKTGAEGYIVVCNNEGVDEFARKIKAIAINIEDSADNRGAGRLLDIDVLFCADFLNNDGEAKNAEYDVCSLGAADSKNLKNKSTNQSINQQRLCSISRNDLGYESRRCLLCDDSAKACARSQKHNMADLLAQIDDICNF